MLSTTTSRNFSGESNFDNWILHFETVASINEWDDVAKLKWMSVCMYGCALTAFCRFLKEV